MSCNYNGESFRTDWTRLHTYMCTPSHAETGAKEMLKHESWMHVVQEIETVRCLAHASGARSVWMLLTPVFPQRNGATEAWFDMFLGSMALKEASFPPLHIIMMMLIIARSCCYKTNSRHCGEHGGKKKRNMALYRKTDNALQSKTTHSPLTCTIQPAGSRDIEGILVYSCNCHNQWVI